MYCKNCGSEIIPGGQFCLNCGAPVHQPAANPAPVAARTVQVPVQNYQAPYQQTYAPQNTPAPHKGPRKGIIIGVAVAAVLIVALVAGLCIYHKVQEEAEHARKAAHHEVTITAVAATGYDTNDSRVPVQVTGTDGNGDSINEQQYVAADGTGLSIPQGTYTLTILASPLTDDGTLYAADITDYQVTIPDDLQESDTCTSDTTITLTTVDALAITDDQIAKATEYAQSDDKFDQTKVDSYRATLIQKRQDALDQKAAEEAAAAAAAQAAANKASIYEHYRSALATIQRDSIAPNGDSLSHLDPYTASDSTFAVEDIDQDGVDELIIRWTSCAVANYAGYVFEYVPDDDSWITEYKGVPGMEFFTNGCMRANSNHNQTYSNFFPCSIYQIADNYYTKLHDVYAIEKDLVAKSKTETYPSEVDTEGAGIVYVVDRVNTSKSDFDNNIAPLIDNSLEIDVNYQTITSSNISSIG